METNVIPLKRFPQVTLWDLQRHTITLRNPLAWDKTGSDRPIQRDVIDQSELCLHRAGEGSKPLFDRDDVLVNQDGMEERTMRVQRSPRSRSSSSSGTSNSSESNSSRSHSKSIPEIRSQYPKPLRFACEKKAGKNSSEQQKDHRSSDDQHSTKRKRDRRSRSPYRKQSVSPYRKQYRDVSRSPPAQSSGSRTVRSPERSNTLPHNTRRRRSPVHSRLGFARSYLRREKSPAAGRSPQRTGRSPHRSGKSPQRTARSPHRTGRSPPKTERSPHRVGRLKRSRERSREGRRRSRSPSMNERMRRSPPRSSRSPHRSSARYKEFVGKGRRSPSRRTARSPHREENELSMYHGQNPGQVTPIDYTHLAHVITQMYPRQPFVPPHLMPQPPEFYPHYGIPTPPQIPLRPRFPIRPPIIYNNRSIKIFRPTESTTVGSGVTTTVTSATSVPLNVSSSSASSGDLHEKSTEELIIKKEISGTGGDVTSSGENSHT